MDDLLAMVQMATECMQAGRADEALLHLGILEAKVAKYQPAGQVGEVPVMGGSIGYLSVPLPLGATLYAKRVN